MRTYEHALSRGCGTGTGDEYGGGYESAREAHVTGQDHDEDPHPIRPAGDTEIQPKADPGVTPIEYQADTNHKKREGEHVGGQLIHSALRDTCQRLTQPVDVVSYMDVEHTPGRVTEGSYTGCTVCLEISRTHVTTALLPKRVAARRHDTTLTRELHQHSDVRSVFRQGADIGRILLGVAVVGAELSHGAHDVVLGEGAP